jgi:HTH-type transcriptional regulator / antitoxin HigA
MIFSDRQYSVSQQQLAKLRMALDELDKDESKHALLRDIECRALQSQIFDIEHEISEYDRLVQGNVQFTERFSLSDLPKTLIQARISKGLTQTDLANLLGMKAQQIQRYEASSYMGANLTRLIEVADALGVRVSESFGGDDLPSTDVVFSWSKPDDIDWLRFPLKEMRKRNWIQADNDNLATAARDYFLAVAGPQFATAYHRKKIRAGNAPNEFALLAWQARVLEQATKQLNEKTFGEFVHDDNWLNELVALTRASRGPQLARTMLREHGIALVIERHLTGTYLDGAAMISREGNPVVALTLRHDRLDNFWFVLFHELAHIFLHLFKSLRFDFFDEEGAIGDDSLEIEADEFSLEKLIPDQLWNRCLSRFALTEESVIIDADNLGVDPSIIAGRIRKERANYQIFNNLIGLGLVRSQLEEDLV